MKLANVFQLFVLALAVPVLSLSVIRVAAQPVQVQPVDPAALTTEVELLLDEWRGQRQILDLAAQKLFEAVKVNPNYAKTYVQICRLHIMAGYRYNQVFEPLALGTAEKAILKAIALDPKAANAYVLQGHLYTNMNRLPEAREALETAEKIGTDNPWLKVNWGALYDRMGQYDRAAEYYRAVISSRTTNRKALGSAYDELTSYYIMKRQWDEAEKLFQTHVRLEPSNAWTRGNYATWLLNSGEFERAIPHARDALKLMEYGAARQTLATALYGKWATMLKQGQDPKEAQGYFDEARTIRPNLDELAVATFRFPASRIIAEVLVEQGLVEKTTILRRR